MKIHSLYVPGVIPGYHGGDPEFCRENAITLSRYGDGYWVFFQNLEPPSTVAQNMAAFKDANAQIESKPKND